MLLEGKRRKFLCDKHFSKLIEGTLQRDMKWIEMDVYARIVRPIMNIIPSFTTQERIISLKPKERFFVVVGYSIYVN